MKEEKKKALIIIGIGAAVFGLLLWLIVIPMGSFSVFTSGRENPDAASFRDELALAEQQTAAEEKYLQEVNQPTDAAAIEEESSLNLIRGKMPGSSPEAKAGSEGQDKNKPKIATLDSLRYSLRDKLKSLGFGGLFGGSGGRSDGYSQADLDKYKNRFAAGSDFKGSNVLTGPMTKKTRFGTISGRGIPSPKLGPSKEDLLAGAAAQKFGEGSGQAKSGESPKGALRDAAENIPMDLKDKNAQNTDRPDLPKKKEKDPCAAISEIDPGDAMLQIGLGFAMLFGSQLLSGLGGASQEAQGQLWNKMIPDVINNFFAPGIKSLLDPDWMIQQCYAQMGNTGGSSGQSSGQSSGGGTQK